MGRKSTATSASDNENKHEQGLQAVLLTADSFTRTFRPLSLDTSSRVLCPLNNVVLLDYALEVLAGVGVEELIVVCGNDAVEAHVLGKQQQQQQRLFASVKCCKDATLTNAGDALRELDKRNWVQSDPFILMHGGDIVTNVDLQPAIQQHKERHKKDSSSIMTILLQPVGSTVCDSRLSHDDDDYSYSYSNIRPTRDDLIVGYDSQQENRILVYDNDARDKRIRIPCSFFPSHFSVELRSDLLDCGIDICSPEVLARFSDEFDYRDIRREFVANSVAEEEEGLQHKLHAHVLQEGEYAAHVSDFCTYPHISADLLQRWCYPVVPDNLPSGYEKEYRYALQRHMMYREQRHPGKVGRSSVLQGPGMVGSRCYIGENCRIVKSVLGHNCRVENAVVLEGCHLWGDNVVEHGATVTDSILGKDSVIRAGATVRRGCLIGNGCVIGANVVLPEYTRITKAIETDALDDNDAFDGDFDDSSSSSSEEKSLEKEDYENDDAVELKLSEVGVAVSDHDVVGPDGIGRVWLPADGDDSEGDSDDDDERINTIKTQSAGFDPTDLYEKRHKAQQEEEDAFSDEEEPLDDHIDYGDYPDGSFTFGVTSSGASASNLNEHGVLITGRQRGVDVVKELKAICLEHEATSSIDNLAIELNSFKFSQNASYSDCTMAATLALLEKMEVNDTGMSHAKLIGVLKHQLDHWRPLLRRMSIGMEEEKSIVLAAETAATSEGVLGAMLRKEPAFRFVLQTFHDEEIVGEEAILAWAAERKLDDVESPLGKLFCQQPTQDFLEWVAEESEDDESDDENSADSD